MEINVFAVLVATVVMFAVGAIWYMVLFGRKWGEMHGFDKLSKKEQKELQSKMGPYYGLQILVTILSAFVLAKLITLVPDYSVYTLAFWVWLGFVLPSQVSAVVFGGTEAKWMVQKIAIMIFESLAHLLAAAFVLEKLL